jgi:hypothetical protein
MLINLQNGMTTASKYFTSAANDGSSSPLRLYANCDFYVHCRLMKWSQIFITEQHIFLYNTKIIVLKVYFNIYTHISELWERVVTSAFQFCQNTQIRNTGSRNVKSSATFMSIKIYISIPICLCCIVLQIILTLCELSASLYFSSTLQLLCKVSSLNCWT